MADDAAIAEALMQLAHERGAKKTFCPSEAARLLCGADWRAHMEDVRRVVAGLPLVATQGGRRVDLRDARGPVRLGLDPAR